jgi:serine/threonine protein kinase/tetratricopeptide (TPR) repeat protein
MEHAAPAERPKRLGPYRVTGLLGQGGMGVVLEGEHEATGARVALKTVRLPSAAYLASLRREIRALSRVRHPGVVRIVDEGVHESLPWYAMELLRGPTLAHLIHKLWTHRIREVIADRTTVKGSLAMLGERTTVIRGAPEPSSDRPSVGPVPSGPRAAAFAGEGGRLLTIVRRLCDTLAFLHGEGIVHRDLKPENVFVREDDTPVMVDFGLVGRGSEAREVLELQILAGTPQYIAPEQLAAQVVDARADLYAVGCILYEVATGRVPYPGASLVELRARLDVPPPPPSLFVRDLPGDLSDLIGRLLARQPRDRVGHAGDVVLALGRHGAQPWPEPAPAPRSYVYRPALVGRVGILDRIRGGLQDLSQGRGGLWLLRGESGIGKTYLAMTAARDAAVLGKNPIVCACEPAAAIALRDAEPAPVAPLQAFAPLLRAIADTCVEHPHHAAELVGASARILAACEPALAELPVFDSAPEPADLPQAAARERLLLALASSLAALARLRPVVLFVDDMQWADELSVAFVASLSPAFFRDNAVLLLGVYRTEEADDGLARIAARPDAELVDLGRLDEEDVAAMVGDMLAHRQVPPAFASFLTGRSEGNPFFVVEYVRTAVAEGLLRRTGAGGWRIPEGDGSWEKLPLPTSLAELVERRLAGLGDDARAVLAAACVIGREVPLDVLALVTGLAEDALQPVVRELVLRHVLDDVTTSGLRFVHDKIRAVAYEAQSAARRRELHAAAGAATLAVRGADDPTVYPALAHHYLMAEDVPRAMEFLERAGEHALASYASGEAATFLGQLVALADGSAAGPLSPEERLRRVRWERQLSEAHFGLGDVNRMLEHAECALRWAGVEPPASSGAWLASLARNLPVQLAHRLLADRFTSADETERAICREASAAMQRLAQRAYFLDANAMVAGSLWSVNLAERAGGAPHVALSYAMLGLTAGVARLRGTAEAYFALARRRAHEHDDRGGLVDIDYAEAAWRSGLGEWPAVYQLLGEAIDLARAIGDRNREHIVRTVLANADFFTGKLRSSKARLVEVTAHGRRSGNPQHLAWGLYGAARAMLPLGEAAEAGAFLEEAARVLAPQAEVPSKIICHALVAASRLAAGDRPGALGAARAALARMSDNRLAAYAVIPACADVAEVLAALAPTFPEAGPAARAAARELAAMAVPLPLAAPYRARVAARLALAAGDEDRARRELERAAGSAARLGLPYERARAHHGLSRLAGLPAEDRAAHRATAEKILRALDCPITPLEAEQS